MSAARTASSRFSSAEQLRGRRVLVLGLGMSGLAVSRALLTAGAEVYASDTRGDLAADPGVVQVAEAGATVETGSHQRADRWLSSADLVVPSPGISPSADLLGKAASEDVPVLSEIELAFGFVRSPVVAVTGTNGKTTTCRMTGSVLEASGRDAVVCGNIGHPFVTAALGHPDADVFVVEVSSFQLNFCRSFHPVVAVVTNLAPDHLDWHGSMEQYRQAKAKIAARQTESDWFVYPSAQPDLAELAPTPGPRRLAFGSTRTDRGGVWIADGRVVASIGSDEVSDLGPAGPLAELGGPFADDALAATTAALACGVPGGVAHEALSRFRPDRHRLEVVAVHSGVRYVDDSKATNPHAALAAIRSFDSVVLIAGGRNKGLDLGQLATESGRLRGVVAMGEAAGDIETAFAGSGVPLRRAGSMGQAVAAARELAAPGDVVLLSPACSSYDSYSNYAERGEAFLQAYRDMVGGTG